MVLRRNAARSDRSQPLRHFAALDQRGRMRDLARRAADEGTALTPEFRRCFRLWFALGVPALASFLAIFYLMVAKPA